MCGYGLSQSTVGIVGLGRIGEAPTTCSPAFSSAISLHNGCPLERLCVARIKTRESSRVPKTSLAHRSS